LERDCERCRQLEQLAVESENCYLEETKWKLLLRVLGVEDGNC